MSLRSEVVRIVNEIFSGSKKISELPAAGGALSSDLIEIARAGVSMRVNVSQIQSVSSGVQWGGLYTFASNAGNLPNSPSDGILYIANDDYGTPGTQEFIPAGTWFMSIAAGSSRSDYSANL